MAAAMFSKFKKKSQKGGKTRRDGKNENALANSTLDETEEAGSLKSGPQDEKSQKQQYGNSNGSSKPSKGQPMMSLSPDHPGSPDCSSVVECPSSSESPEMKTMKKNKSLATDISGANAIPVESTGPQIPVNNDASANLFTPPGLRASKSHLGDSDAQNSENNVTSSSRVTDYGHSSQANQSSTAASTCTNLPTQMPQIDVEVADQQQGSPCNTQSVSDTSSRFLSQNPENSEVSSSKLAASNQASQMNQPAINTRDPPNPEMEDLSGVPRNENDNSLESLSGHPIQEEQNNAEASQNEATVNTYENFFVSEKILGDKFLLEKLAVRLDRTPNRAIKNWEHLACTKEIAAPLEMRLKCKLSSEKRYTMMLFDVLTAEHDEDKTVKDLMDALTRMKRNDVKKIITDVFPDAANSSQELSEFIASNFNAVADVATLLDQTSNVNKYWFHLGLEFGVSRVHLKEIEYGQSTQDLMEYLYTKKPHLTIGTFYGVIEKSLKRKDVLKILRPFVEEVGGREKMMKDAIPLESDTMRSICVCLNNPSPALRNWRYLAKSPELGIPDEVYMDCKPDKLKSPTEGLLEWATANRNDLKIGELCCAFKSMDRNDIVGYIAEYFQQQSTAVQQH